MCSYLELFYLTCETVGVTEWHLKSLFVSRKFYPDFEYEKITSLNLRLSLVLLLSHCFLDDARGQHFAEVSNSRDNV